MRRLFNLQISEGGSVVDHIIESNVIVSQLSSVEINFEDEIKVSILMSSLLESWGTVVAAISSSRGSNKLKFDEIRDVVLSESICKREIRNSTSSALVLTNGEEVNQRAQTMGVQNQGTEKNLQTNQM